MLHKQILIITIIIQLTTFSCKKEVINNKHKIKSYNQKQIDYEIEFPDTVYVNHISDGLINYKSKLDTIITTFGDKKKNRYTRFILTTTDNPNYDFKQLKETVKDTFGALNNRNIPFYDINFSKTGTFYIDGVINDIILIDLNKKDKDGFTLSRLIENEERITKKVIVINDPKHKSK